MTTWWNLTLELERAISERLADYTPDTWKEDAITIDIVKSARRILNNAILDEEYDKSQVLARVLKADGPLEERYGDLAVVVKAKYRDGQTLNGVAYYEAKRRDWNSSKIPALKKAQLVKMNHNVRNGHLLLFDPERIVSRLTETVYSPWWIRDLRIRRDANLVAATQALAIPLGPAIQSQQLDVSLYKFGTPFASQLILRNLQGLDLDHDKTVLHMTRAYAKRMNVPALPIRARVVLAVGINHGPGDPELPEINPDAFQIPNDQQ